MLIPTKLLLAFAGFYTFAQARTSWITAFNVKSTTKLLYCKSLLNSLFFVSVEEHLGGLTKAQLIKEASHLARDKFATINPYQSMFDPQNPLLFKFLITIRIKKGTHDIFEIIDDIVAHIGIIADRDIGTGKQPHMITALMFTTEREFTHHAYVPLEQGKVLFVDFEFYEPYL